MASQKEKQSVMNQLESFYENMSEKKEAKLLGLMAFFMNEINKLQDEHGYSSTKDRLDRGQQLPNPTKVTSLIDDSLTASCILQQFASKLHAHKKSLDFDVKHELDVKHIFTNIGEPKPSKPSKRRAAAKDKSPKKKPRAGSSGPSIDRRISKKEREEKLKIKAIEDADGDLKTYREQKENAKKERDKARKEKDELDDEDEDYDTKAAKLDKLEKSWEKDFSKNLACIKETKKNIEKMTDELETIRDQLAQLKAGGSLVQDGGDDDVEEEEEEEAAVEEEEEVADEDE